MKRERKVFKYVHRCVSFFCFVLFRLCCVCVLLCVCLFLDLFLLFYFLTVAIISTDITNAHTLPNLQRMIVAIEFCFVNFVAYNADGNQTNGQNNSTDERWRIKVSAAWLQCDKIEKENNECNEMNLKLGFRSAKLQMRWTTYRWCWWWFLCCCFRCTSSWIWRWSCWSCWSRWCGWCRWCSCGCRCCWWSCWSCWRCWCSWLYCCCVVVGYL